MFASDTLIFNQDKSSNGTIIWLHGLGADKFDLLPFYEELRSAKELAHFFLQAPNISVSMFGGERCAGWFDITTEDMNISGIIRDQAGLHKSITKIARFMQNQCATGVAPNKLMLAGFSQGGAMALATTLACTDTLAGCVCLSGWLVRNAVPTFSATDHKIEKPTRIRQHPRANSFPPILLHHGSSDDVVPAMATTIARRRLDKMKLTTQVEFFESDHSISSEQTDAVDRYLAERFRLTL